MTAVIETEGRGVLSVRITGVASTDNSGQGAVANPEGDDVLVLRTTLVVLTASSGAANISIGIGATATTASTDIINALAMNGVAANTCYNGHVMQNGAKTAITAPALWTPTSYLNITGSASLVGLDARLLVEYVRIN